MFVKIKTKDNVIYTYVAVFDDMKYKCLPSCAHTL